ncbi:FAD-binding oxidoreductase [Alloacidobacterium dinghuense]|uniref:FAD-binding oxidoreductase n=1 Tax=Alloacidobacterium dinghuense TaxID=2763107 RepID=A0A7G8BN49_9BACT|nr:FAD-binding oxidoreductase [Alloacidobacterium dinghuense]QNI33969.1 FAD-binding oxidoreductase [Alloacidobacterium dinghuense]
MALVTRRHFVRQTALAAALYGCQACAIGEARQLFGAQEQSGPPLDAAMIRKLAAEIVGQVITPDGPEYEAARLIFNLAFDRRPAVIVRCAAPSDLARTLDFSQTKNLTVAVHGGGHSRLGYGMCDGGVVIDLSGMKRVEVDADKRVARAEAGALVRDLDEATQRFGRATTSGGCPTVGIAGLTLGGGEGRLMDKYGLACDNLLSAQVVTVDGRSIEASQKSNPDLFWAIRGGGGNFGVVTALEYQLHPVGEVVSGTLMYPAGRIPDLLQAFVRFLAEAPDEMDAFAQLLPSERGPRFKIDVCYCGDPRMGTNVLRPLRALKPQDDSVKVMYYLEAQAAGGFLQAPVAHFQTNLILRELSGSAIAAITTAINDAPARCKVIIVPLRGAVTRINLSDTAYALRQPGYELDMAGVWSNPLEKTEVVRWVNSARDTLLPFAHGVYVNQLGDTSDQLVRSAYGLNYARLMELKKKYDPNNVLRLNQNIKPA